MHDEAKFCAIWYRYALKIALSKNLSDPDDAAQAGVLAVWKASKVKTTKKYLAGACANGVNEWIRNDIAQRKGVVFLEETWGEGISTEEAADTERGLRTLKQVSDEEDFTAVDVADFLERLTDTERLIVRLRMDGLTLREIAPLAGLSHQGVKDVLTRLQGLWPI